MKKYKDSEGRTLFMKDAYSLYDYNEKYGQMEYDAEEFEQIMKYFGLIKDFSKLSNEELIERYHNLHEEWDMALEMDGSGECGGMIAGSFQPDICGIEKELNKRGIELYSHDDIPDEDDALPF